MSNAAVAAAWLAAIATGLLAVFKPAQINAAYRGAWRHLDNAVNQSMEAENLSGLSAAIGRGERIISTNYPKLAPGGTREEA